MNKIKIAQIGICHEHAPGKIHTLREHLAGSFEIVGYVDESGFAATPWLPAARQPELYRGLPRLTMDEALNYPGLQAVLIEMPNNELVPTAQRFAERGVAIHMDKPPGEDRQAYRRLLGECERRRLPFQMGYMFRNNPAMNFAGDAIARGWLGEIFAIDCGMSHNYGDASYHDYIGKFAGGVMFNLGCHLIDFAVAVLGRPCTVVPILRSAPGFEEPVRNNCVAVLEYPHALVTLHVSSCEIGGIEHRRMKICGTGGTLEFSPLERFDGAPQELAMTLARAADGVAAGARTIGFEPRSDRYVEQLGEFAGMIRGQVADRYTREHDLLVHEVTLRASGFALQAD